MTRFKREVLRDYLFLQNFQENFQIIKSSWDIFKKNKIYISESTIYYLKILNSYEISMFNRKA